MNLIPAIGFYYRRHQQIASLAVAANKDAAVDVVQALLPVINKHWPQLNKDGILDDLLKTMTEMQSTPPVV